MASSSLPCLCPHTQVWRHMICVWLSVTGPVFFVHRMRKIPEISTEKRTYGPQPGDSHDDGWSSKSPFVHTVFRHSVFLTLHLFALFLLYTLSFVLSLLSHHLSLCCCIPWPTHTHTHWSLRQPRHVAWWLNSFHGVDLNAVSLCLHTCNIHFWWEIIIWYLSWRLFTLFFSLSTSPPPSRRRSLYLSLMADSALLLKGSAPAPDTNHPNCVFAMMKAGLISRLELCLCAGLPEHSSSGLPTGLHGNAIGATPLIVWAQL